MVHRIELPRPSFLCTGPPKQKLHNQKGDTNHETGNNLDGLTHDYPIYFEEGAIITNSKIEGGIQFNGGLVTNCKIEGSIRFDF